MGIIHIEPGQVFKSQKDLCEYIGIKYNDNTNSRKAQIKEFDRRFKYHKEGRKIIIDEIYDEIKEKVDNRGKSNSSRNNNIYGKYIDLILKSYFINTCKENSTIYRTTNELAEKCGIINVNYKSAYNNKSKFYKYINEIKGVTNITSVNDVFTFISRSIQNVSSSLKRLQDEKIIKYEKTYLVYCGNKYRAATSKEITIIQSVEQRVLQEMNINKSRLPYDDILRNRYYNKVNELVSIETHNVVKISIGYKINIIKNNINIDFDVNEIIKRLNEIVIEKIYEKIKNTHEKIKDKKIHKFLKALESSMKLDKQNEDRIDFNYLHNSKNVIDCLVQLKYKNITRLLY